MEGSMKQGKDGDLSSEPKRNVEPANGVSLELDPFLICL
jgi:hypothetical protein